MCSSHQPETGADGRAVINYLPEGGFEWVREPTQITCGHWIENESGEGFCALEPGHEQGCQPPKYEDLD